MAKGSHFIAQIEALQPIHEITKCGVPEAWRLLVQHGEDDPQEMVMWMQGVLMKHTLPPIHRPNTR